MFRDHVYLLQAPEGESQPSTEVDLFISTEKIMVLNTDLKVSRALLFMFVLCLQDFLLCATVIIYCYYYCYCYCCVRR